MSSKFFTWTKGDRRTASVALRSEEFVTIPAELRINGMDYARSMRGSGKPHRKPLPLPLDQSPQSASDEPPKNSLALHDAAVRSATSLMAVMNEMLKSAPVSAHLAEKQRSAGLQPMHGRPRSHSVPATPMAEAPFVEPVELPGSLIQGADSQANKHYTYNPGSTFNVSTASLPSPAVGRSIERPHSSPQEATYSVLYNPRGSMDAGSQHSLYPPPQASPRSKFSSPAKTLRKVSTVGSIASSEDFRVSSSHVELVKPSMQRPSLSVLQSTPPTQQPTHESADLDISNAPHQGLSNKEDGTMMSHISAIRLAHEAHIQSLRDTHDKELESFRIYITMLEDRYNKPKQTNGGLKRHLTIDTDQSSGRVTELLSSDGSATTLQSFETSLENHKRATQDPVLSADIESLKRKLSLARRAQAEAADIKRERDSYRHAAERSDRRIIQLKDIVRKAKENEKSLKNATEALETRLVEANNERVDVLEGFHEACENVKRLQCNLSERRQQVEGLETQLRDADLATFPRQGRSKEERQPSETPSATAHDDQDYRSELSRLTGLLDDQEKLLADVREERDRYNSLLHSELRRTSRGVAQKAHTATPEIKTEALARMNETMAEIRGRGNAEIETSDEHQTYTILEKELEHCVKEIIMYKLDVKGYRKDLKRAQAKIASLQSSLERRSSETRQSKDSGVECLSAGLGIDMGEALSSPTRTLRSATSQALLATSPPASFDVTLPPRSKTPLGAHKKLPKPPVPRTPSPMLPSIPSSSPPPARRADTFRSLSESIISSYAYRTSPDIPNATTTPKTKARSYNPIPINGANASGSTGP